MTDCYRSPDEFAYASIGWTTAIVDQVIPILDFCRRNEIDLQSADNDFASIGEGVRQKIVNLLGMPTPIFHVAHFSMNETKIRHFPAAHSLSDTRRDNAL